MSACVPPPQRSQRRAERLSSGAESAESSVQSVRTPLTPAVRAHPQPRCRVERPNARRARQPSCAYFTPLFFVKLPILKCARGYEKLLFLWL